MQSGEQLASMIIKESNRRYQHYNFKMIDCLYTYATSVAIIQSYGQCMDCKQWSMEIQIASMTKGTHAHCHIHLLCVHAMNGFTTELAK